MPYIKNKVSVIIPVFNMQEFIERALRSAAEIDLVGEVLVVDDGSKDDSMAIVSKLQRIFPDKIKIVQHPGNVNKGPAATRNLGIKNAKCEWVAFLDADDYYLPHRFDKAVEILQNDKKLDGVYEAIGTHFYDEKGRDLHYKRMVDLNINTLPLDLTTLVHAVPSDILYEALLMHNIGWFHFNGLTLRNSFQGENDFLDEKVTFGEDIEFFLRLSLNKKLTAGNLLEPVAMRGVYEGNGTLSVFTSPERKQKHRAAHHYMWKRQFMQIFKNTFPKYLNRFILNRYLDNFNSRVQRMPVGLFRKIYKFLILIFLIFRYPNLILKIVGGKKTFNNQKYNVTVQERKYQVCTHCVMDNANDPDITFDLSGICNYCRDYTISDPNKDKSAQASIQEYDQIINEIKSQKGRSKYDCILGISGGADSTYLCHLAKESGLNPLVVHYDNGWNSELAVKNIESVLKVMNLDLFTYVDNWEEIRSLQRAFIKASVVDIELITDQAIVALIHNLALKENVKYIITGHNYATEAILPKSWYHWKVDVLNIEAINNLYGDKPLKSYPRIHFWKRYFMERRGKVKQICLLNYTDYDKSKAKLLLSEKYGWRDYGGKHYESIFTRFYQGYILPVKFNIDKRRAHLSTLINSGQTTRELALEELKKPTYDSNLMAEDKIYVLKKLGFTEDEFDNYMTKKEIPHLHYPSYINRHYKYLRRIKSLFRPFKS